MNRRVKRVLAWSGIAAGVLILAACGYLYYLYNSAKHTAAKIYEAPAKPVYVSKDPDVQKRVDTEAKTPDRLKPFTVLALGVDQRPHDTGRSDTIILMAVNPAKKSILMFNIPRDTRTDIVGHGTVDKINHAYAFGGVNMSIQTIERFLDYPVDYYIKVNMEGFARLIDLIGGVEVDNPFAFNYEQHTFAKGHLTLNGDEALLYSRMRYDDPRGDLGRNARQRDILEEVMKHAMNLTNVTKIDSMLSEVGDSVKTNITFDEMKQFLTDYRPAIGSIDTVEIQGKGQTIGGIWYYIVSDAERSRIHNLLKNQMQ
ncbi:LCP family protein [Paenibacillus humicola]|uniref:LCP family glycopolymer transferase n=1 Tax=Paenibacillus humicola TaxID=3110540 RepID=UPI00237A847E|nr:LCP family protein [Paenibacillus humicola]